MTPASITCCPPLPERTAMAPGECLPPSVPSWLPCNLIYPFCQGPAGPKGEKGVQGPPGHPVSEGLGPPSVNPTSPCSPLTLSVFPSTRVPQER